MSHLDPNKEERDATPVLPAMRASAEFAEHQQTGMVQFSNARKTLDILRTP